MTQKLTPWYPVSIKPVRNGVYEVVTPNSYANKFAYYDKKGWRLCAATANGAEAEKPYLVDIFFSSMTLRKSKWRGIAK